MVEGSVLSVRTCSNPQDSVAFLEVLHSYDGLVQARGVALSALESSQCWIRSCTLKRTNRTNVGVAFV